MANNNIFEIIRNHDIESLTRIIKQGFDINCRMTTAPFWTPLQEAIDELDDGGEPKMIQTLVEAGADVNAWNLPKDCNPLLMTIWGEHDDITRLLLEAEANPNIRDDEGNSPLRLSAENENLSVVKMLPNYGAKTTINEAGGFGGMSALGIAVSRVNIPIIKILLDAGADPEATDNDYRKALERLPRESDIDVQEKIKKLLTANSE